MLKPGGVLDLGPLATKFIIRRTPSESGAQTFDMEWELAPHTGGTPLHLHPPATETYEILEGSLDVNINGTWRTLGQGDRRAVDPGTPHTFRNASDALTRVYNTHQPAILSIAVLMTSYEDEICSVRPPHLLMRAFALVGRVLGYGRDRERR